MTEAPQGPGWWQASDHKWYPPEPPTPPPAAPGQGLAAAKEIASRLSPTAWLLFGGFVIAVIATFFPLVTFSDGFLGMNSGFNGMQRLVVFVLVGVAAWLAWPLVSGSQIAVNRLIGLSAADGVFAALMLYWFSEVSTINRQMEGLVDVSPGFGLMACGAAIVLIAIGVVRLWIQQTQTQHRA
jgi:hypothetical protein